MPMPDTSKPKEREGELELLKKGFSKAYGMYKPGELMAAEAGIKFGVTVKMLEIDSKTSTISVFPKITLPRHPDFLEPKYGKVEKLTCEMSEDFSTYLKNRWSKLTSEDLYAALFEALLSGFTKDPDYGLELAVSLKDIVDAVEAHTDCHEIYIGSDIDTGVKNSVFMLSVDDFEEAKRKIASVTSLGQKAAAEVKDVSIYNLIATRLGVDQKEIRFGRSPIRKGITAAVKGQVPLTEGDQIELIDILSSHSKQVAKSKPGALAKLQEEIELVTLEVLISRYEVMLTTVTNESDWQRFFRENTFALTMAFGYPVIVIAEQASVGGGQLFGGGSKYSDFLVKNTQTHNAAIFEIKTPATKLLNKVAYRGKVYSAATDFSGSIAQVLDQRYQLVKSLPGLKDNDRALVVESYAVGCCLIIGMTPLDVDEKKSFELFRNNSKDVEILTFDELLEKLKQLHVFLSNKTG